MRLEREICGLKIRNLRKDELKVLEKFTYLALYVPEGEEKFPYEIVFQPEISKYYKDIDLDREVVLVAVEDDEIIGAIWERLLDADKRGYGYYKSSFSELMISIDFNHRQKGIGNQLMIGFLDRLSEIGREGVSLSVSYGNNAIHLYEKFGFEVVKCRDDDILMIKILKSK